MESNTLSRLWQSRQKDINTLAEAHARLKQQAAAERRAVPRTAVTEVGCLVEHENYLGLLVEMNQLAGGAFIVEQKPEFSGQAVTVTFHPNPALLERVRREHGHSGISPVGSFDEPVRIRAVRELTDYGIWLCAFTFADSAGPQSPRRRLVELMKDSFIERLTQTFLGS